MLNDADAAGIAEMKWGAGRDEPGTVMMLTFGTGIGSALFVDGLLVPNTELGHLEMHGMDAEEWASARIRTELSLDWPAWIERVNEYLDTCTGYSGPTCSSSAERSANATTSSPRCCDRQPRYGPRSSRDRPA